MKKRTLIFDDSVEGHHLEYIHHLYMSSVAKINEEFVFILAPKFKILRNKLTWPQCYNITIDYLSERDTAFLKNKFIKSYFLCRILKETTNKYNISNIFLISLMDFIPFLPIFFNKKIKISGIIYLIYLYRWKNSSIKIKIYDSIKYLIFSRSKIFEHVFLLNDKVAPIYLNKKYNTSVFHYLPDPFVPLFDSKLKNLRNDLNIQSEKIICLHFGALTERKGTIEILKAITLVNESILNKCCFIFAGKVCADIKESFYLLIDEVEKKTQIIIYDKFCDYDFIGSLCLTSNYILIPYKNSEQSSGLLGYAAQFNVPIVGPRGGILGKLIKKYNLGLLLERPSVECLAQFINNIEKPNLKVKSNYIQENTVELFNEIIFK